MASTNRHAARPGSGRGHKDAKVAKDAKNNTTTKHKSAAAKLRARAGPRAALPTSDDAWRRKLEIAKTAGVRRAKTKAQYRKLKARVGAGGTGEKGATGANAAPVKGMRSFGKEEGGEETGLQAAKQEEKTEVRKEKRKKDTTEPQPQADSDSDSDVSDSQVQSQPKKKKTKTTTSASTEAQPQHPPATDEPPVPLFFKKARDEAAARRAAAEAHAAEQARRSVERAAKRAERAKLQKAMAKARRGDFTQEGGASGASDGRRRKLGRESDVLLLKARKLMAA